jgi:hypothetical protein
MNAESIGFIQGKGIPVRMNRKGTNGNIRYLPRVLNRTVFLDVRYETVLPSAKGVFMAWCGGYIGYGPLVMSREALIRA